MPTETIEGLRPAAAAAQITVAKLRRAIDRGVIPAELVAGRWRFRRSDLAALGEGHARPAERRQATLTPAEAEIFAEVDAGRPLAEIALEHSVDPVWLTQRAQQWTAMRSTASVALEDEVASLRDEVDDLREQLAAVHREAQAGVAQARQEAAAAKGLVDQLIVELLGRLVPGSTVD